MFYEPWHMACGLWLMTCSASSEKHTDVTWYLDANVCCGVLVRESHSCRKATLSRNTQSCCSSQPQQSAAAVVAAAAVGSSSRQKQSVSTIRAIASRVPSKFPKYTTCKQANTCHPLNKHHCFQIAMLLCRSTQPSRILVRHARMAPCMCHHQTR